MSEDTGQMNEDGVRVTRIDWQTAIPSLRLLDAIRLAISLHVFVPALLLMFLTRAASQFSYAQFGLLTSEISRHSLLDVSDFKMPGFLDTISGSMSVIATGGGSQLSASEVTVILGLWMLMFGFCGVVAIRSAGCRTCTGTESGLFASAKLSLHSWKSIVVSAVLTWILLGLLCTVFRVFCWAGAGTSVGITTVASLMYIVGCMVLGIGWLLSLAAIAIDRCDGAEALSRGICYVLSHWLRVVVYCIVFCLLMMSCDVAFSWLAINAHRLASAADATSAGGTTLQLTGEVVRLSLFFCEIAVAYVLLRNLEDGVSPREIDGGRVIKSSHRLD